MGFNSEFKGLIYSVNVGCPEIIYTVFVLKIKNIIYVYSRNILCNMLNLLLVLPFTI